MFASIPWSSLLASVLALGLATAHAADDVFVKEGVIIKPLPKWKQRRMEKKLLRHPGNKVVIEGSPTADLTPDVLAGARTRRAMRPLFGDLFNRRNDFIVAPPVIASPSVVVTTPSTIVTSPSTIVSIPRSSVAPGDPLVMPGSVEIESPAPIVRPPVISTPRRSPIESTDEPELEADRPGSIRVLPPPADEIPPPVVSTPRKASASPNPGPILEPTPPSPTLEPTPPNTTPAPSVDPGPTPPVTPPVAEPVVEPILELPAAPRPA